MIEAAHGISGVSGWEDGWGRLMKVGWFCAIVIVGSGWTRRSYGGWTMGRKTVTVVRAREGTDGLSNLGSSRCCSAGWSQGILRRAREGCQGICSCGLLWTAACNVISILTVCVGYWSQAHPSRHDVPSAPLLVYMDHTLPPQTPTLLKYLATLASGLAARRGTQPLPAPLQHRPLQLQTRGA